MAAKTEEKMIQREIAVAVSNANQGVHVFDTIDSIQKAGFKYVFIQWYNNSAYAEYKPACAVLPPLARRIIPAIHGLKIKCPFGPLDFLRSWYNRKWNPTQEEQLEYIRRKGLHVIFAHLGYQNINHLWLDTEDGKHLVERYKNDIRICKENGIPMVIMHLTGKNDAPNYNEIGIRRLREIVEYAKSLHVKVAFENTKHKGYLEYVTENMKDENAGICFDSGHYHVYFDDDLDLAKWKDRIFAIHLHDNDKSDDLHLIPFDGTIDWKKIIAELKLCNYNGPITLELCYRYGYLNMSLDDFYKKGYEAGGKLLELFE